MGTPGKVLHGNAYTIVVKCETANRIEVGLFSIRSAAQKLSGNQMPIMVQHTMKINEFRYSKVDERRRTTVFGHLFAHTL